MRAIARQSLDELCCANIFTNLWAVPEDTDNTLASFFSDLEARKRFHERSTQHSLLRAAQLEDYVLCPPTAAERCGARAL
jgi:hypothetical protein